jgi:hypothetical protein
MKKIIVCNILALLMLVATAACSESAVVAPPGDNRTYTVDEVVAIASKFDPDCRRFTPSTDNTAPSG